MPSCRGWRNVLELHPEDWNRWILLSIYLIINATSTWVYFGWSALSALFFEDDVYSWLCQKDTNGFFSPDMRLEGKPFICDAQDVRIQSLFTCAMIGHLIGSPLTGFLLDICGMRLPEILGGLLNLTGWLLIGFSSESFLAYPYAFALISMGGDLIFVPTMRITSLFPGNDGAIAATIGASTTASPFVASIMYFVKKGYPSVTSKQVFVLYALIIALPVLIAGATCFPKQFDQASEVQKIRSQANSEQTFVRRNSLLAAAGIISPGRSAILDESNPAGRSSNISPRTIVVSTINKSPSQQSPNKRHSCFVQGPFIMPEKKSFKESILDGWKNMKMSLQYAKKLDFIVVGVLFPIIADSCIIIGRLADSIGMGPILMFISLCGAASTLCLAGHSDLAHYFAITFFFFFVSFIEIGIYCYLDITLPREFLGRLYGIAICLGGIAGITSFFIYDGIGIRYLGGNFDMVFIGYSILLFIIALMFGFITITGRSPVPARSIKKEKLQLPTRRNSLATIT